MVARVVGIFEWFLRELKLGVCRTPVYRKIKPELILKPICSRLVCQADCLTKHANYLAQCPLHPII